RLWRHGRGGRGELEELAGPLDEVFHVRAIFVSAVVLAPSEFAVEEAGVHGRHFRRAIIFFLADVARAEETEHGTGGDGRHIAALLVEPIRVTARRDAVADEG